MSIMPAVAKTAKKTPQKEPKPDYTLMAEAIIARLLKIKKVRVRLIEDKWTHKKREHPVELLIPSVEAPLALDSGLKLPADLAVSVPINLLWYISRATPTQDEAVEVVSRAAYETISTRLKNRVVGLSPMKTRQEFEWALADRVKKHHDLYIFSFCLTVKVADLSFEATTREDIKTSALFSKEDLDHFW
ncbi:MAG: hypothetical protein V1838_03075, partial [Patescibacteria group bacterium]